MSVVRGPWSVVRTPGFVIFSFWSVVCLTSAHASDFKLMPSIVVSEEYNDNVFETRDNKKTDYITRALPGIALKYNAPFWDWDIAYNFDYRYYARNSREHDNSHNLLGKGLIKIIDDFLFLDVADTYRRVSLNVARDVTQESLFVNQSDSNTFTASPYFLFHPGSKVTVKAGGRYTNVWYKDPNAIDKREYGGFADATYEYSSKMSLNAGYAFTYQNSINAYDKHAPYAGARYEYADKSFVFANGGYTWFEFKNGVSSKNPYWNGGITHTFGTYSVYLNAGVQYPEDPVTGVTKETNYNFGINKSFDRGIAGLSVYYSKYSRPDTFLTIANVTNTDISKKYGASVNARYDITTGLSGNLNASVEKYDHYTGSYTRRIYVNPGLSYLFPMDITVSLNYNFIDYYSPGIFSDNYQVNRVVLEARKSF
jgi:hypothetical protein